MYLSKISESGEGELMRLIGAMLISDDGDEIGRSYMDTDGVGLIVRSLYVDPLYRCRGGGSLLLQGACDMGRSAGLLFAEAFFFDPEGVLEEFFLKNGFLISKGHPVYSLMLKNVLRSQELAGIGNPDDRCLPVSKLSLKQKKRLLSLINEANYPELVIGAREELSFVYIDEEGMPSACLIANSAQEEGCLRIELILNREKDKPARPGKLFVALIWAIRDMFPGDIRLEFVCANEKVLSFVNRIVQKKENLVLKGYVSHAVRVLGG